MKDKKERRILVLYTGGTIGMYKENGSGSLKPGGLEEFKGNVNEGVDKLGYDVEYKPFKFNGEFIDSADASVEYYNELAEKIASEIDGYDGVVIAFGTDTMGPSAGALSYMLEGLRKPVVFTGAMLPVGEEGSDGPRNLEDAIELVAQSGNEIPPVNEVSVCFHNKIIRGTHAYKQRSHDIDAFEAPGHDFVGMFEEDESGSRKININEKELLPEYPENYEFRLNRLDPSFSVTPLVGVMSIDNIIKNTQDFSGAYLFYNNEISEERAIEIESMIPKETPIFFQNHSKRPNPRWLKSEGVVDYQQMMAKIRYCMSISKDPGEIKKLYESNLRGEGNGEIKREREILKESDESEIIPERELNLK